MNQCLNCKKYTKNPKFCSLKCSNKIVLPPSIQITKICKTCKNKCYKRRIYCDDCWNKKEELRKAKKPKYHIKNREKYNEYLKIYMRNRYKKRKNEWIIQLGGACTKCGSVEELEIDHIDYHTKNYEISNLYSYKKSIVQEELKKCQLLCKVCHKEKTKLDSKDIGCENIKRLKEKNLFP